MLKLRLHIILAVIAAVMLAAPFASGKEDPKKKAARVRQLHLDINRAMSVLRRDPERAIVELKGLLRTHPDKERQILEKLGYAFAYAGKVDSALTAYETVVRYEPISLFASRELGRLYINLGDREKAEALFDEVIKRSPSKLQAYRSVAETQTSVGWHDEAMKVYRQGRLELKKPTAFAIQIGDLEKLMGHEEVALEEYVTYALSKGANIMTAKKRVGELFRRPEADRDALFRSLDEQARAREGDLAKRSRVLEIQSSAYLECGLLENALEKALEADRISVSKGTPFYHLLNRIYTDYGKQPPNEKRRYLDLCLRAVDAYLGRHPTATTAPDAYFIRASLLIDLSSGRIPGAPVEERQSALAQALETLDFILKTYPGTPHAERAILGMGDIQFYYLKQPAEALKIYRRGMKRSKEYQLSFAEQIAKVYLVLGEDREAEKYLATLIKSPNRELRETGFYYTGVMLAFTGDYATAKDTLTALAEGDPSSSLANDAIDFAWVLELGLKGDEESLKSYLASIKSDFAGDSTMTIELLEPFMTGSKTALLRSRAIYRLGSLYAGQGLFDAAIANFQALIDDHPEDPLVPDANCRIARVYEYGFGDKERALKMYEHVLMVHPDYMFLDEVRKNVMRLRGEDTL